MKMYRTCRICKAVFYNKSWHHGDHVKLLEFKKGRFAWTTRCPACKIVEAQKFEGQVTITNVPSLISSELLYLIKKYTQQEYEKNCQHRLIKVVKQDAHTWVLTTTNAQLADKLANKIGQAFDHVDVSTTYADKSGSLSKIIVEFLPLFYHRFNFERI